MINLVQNIIHNRNPQTETPSEYFSFSNSSMGLSRDDEPEISRVSYLIETNDVLNVDIGIDELESLNDDIYFCISKLETNDNYTLFCVDEADCYDPEFIHFRLERNHD